jgi:hypothetical protein
MERLRLDTAVKLSVERREDGWWITGLPCSDVPASGPYSRRDDAEDDRRGLERTFRYWDDPSYFTSCLPGERVRLRL